jgi:hypothetical protein
MKQKFLKTRNILPFIALLFLISSCIDGFNDDSTWASTVRDAQLGNPEITVMSSSDGTELIVSWSIVPGAGGYEVSVYNVDDPGNPIAIGEANQIIDGFVVRRPATEDTKFRASVRTLDNPKMNNKGATTPAVKDYNNLLPVFAVIPPGNLTEYFAANPVPLSQEELCYELVPGGNYTITGNLSFGKTGVTIRGGKVDHAVIEMTDGSFIVEGAKFKLQFIDVNYSNFMGPQGSSSFILMSTNFPPNGDPSLNNNNYLHIPSITIQSCKITGLKYNIFWDNGRRYAIGSFIIKDCIIGHSTPTFNVAIIRFATGMVKELTLTNSTFYNDNPPTADNSQRFIQISTGNATSVGPEWLSGSMTVTNCTFWQVAKNNQLGNSNGAMRTGSDKVVIQKNIFVDSGQQTNNIWNFRMRNTNTGNQVFTGGQNTQWWGGEDLYSRAGSNEASYDVAPINSNPGLTYEGNGRFKITGAAQIAARTGDPRWYE